MYQYFVINCSAVYNWRYFSGPLPKCTGEFPFEGCIRAYEDVCPHPALPTSDSQGRRKRRDCKIARLHSLSPCPRSVCSQNLEAVCSWRDPCPSQQLGLQSLPSSFQCKIRHSHTPQMQLLSVVLQFASQQLTAYPYSSFYPPLILLPACTFCSLCT